MIESFSHSTRFVKSFPLKIKERGGRGKRGEGSGREGREEKGGQKRQTTQIGAYTFDPPHMLGTYPLGSDGVLFTNRSHAQLVSLCFAAVTIAIQITPCGRTSKLPKCYNKTRYAYRKPDGVFSQI